MAKYTFFEAVLGAVNLHEKVISLGVESADV